jgi:2,3-bisphosphoglycerate-dependent phosphoglycerate mutase
MSKYEVVMIRHGESEWNQANLFCGWFDSDLSDAGRAEAEAAGKALKDAGKKFDIAHSSLLQRANKTCQKVLELTGSDCPMERTWRLNERHYGGLTGKNKLEAVEKFGAEQVQIWRRSYATPPPTMEEDHEYFQTIQKNPLYADVGDEIPNCESLQLTIKRTLPYWNDVIVPQIKEGKKLLIAAHGNSLRGIVKHLDDMTEERIMGLNLPTGIPFVYEFDENMKPTVSMKFLGDEVTVKAAMEKVAAQTGAKK